MKSERPPQRIVCAAMLMKDGLIVTGIRHYSPEMRLVLKRIYMERPYKYEVKEQGFVDQYGTFLNREEAWLIAEREGQIRQKVSSPGTLFSESLY